MGFQTLNVELPDALVERLERIASTTNQPFDAILLQTIRGNLPPTLDDVPKQYHSELSGLLKLNDDDLWAVAHVSTDPRKFKRHEALLRKNTERALSPSERAELEQMRAEMDQLVYRKSFVMALLKWHGHDLSSLIPHASNGIS